MSSRSEPQIELVSAPPVFFLNEEIPDDVTHVDICQCAEKLVGFGAIVGAQRLGGLWRLYPISKEVRAKLLLEKLLIQGRAIPLRSQNPFAVRNSEGKEIPSTRLSIDGLPVSISSSDIEGYLRKEGTNFRSPILWEKARDRNGKLTRWVTGRRFVWIDLPTTPLKNRIQVGSFMAKLYYREQPKPEIQCFDCQKVGHKRFDPICEGPAIWGHKMKVSMLEGKSLNETQDTLVNGDGTSSDEVSDSSIIDNEDHDRELSSGDEEDTGSIMLDELLPDAQSSKGSKVNESESTGVENEEIKKQSETYEPDHADKELQKNMQKVDDIATEEEEVQKDRDIKEQSTEKGNKSQSGDGNSEDERAGLEKENQIKAKKKPKKRANQPKDQRGNILASRLNEDEHVSNKELETKLAEENYPERTEKEDRKSGHDRSRPKQTTLSAHFKSERAPSLKRQGSSSPNSEGNDRQRPRHDK